MLEWMDLTKLRQCYDLVYVKMLRNYYISYYISINSHYIYMLLGVIFISANGFNMDSNFSYSNPI